MKMAADISPTITTISYQNNHNKSTVCNNKIQFLYDLSHKNPVPKVAEVDAVYHSDQAMYSTLKYQTV